MEKRISIVKDFSSKPFGRYPSDGKFNGQRFRTEVLLPAFRDKSCSKIIVDLNGVDRGYGSSFLEESFGGLIREGITIEDIRTKLVIKINDKDYEIEINEYMEEASRKV